jgi:capsular exopolysaccharide synthesis family protein
MIYEPQAKSADRSVAGLEDYIEAVRKRKALVAGCFLAALALTSVYTSRRQPTYTASAAVLLYPTPLAGVLANGQFSSPQLDREAQILSSELIGSIARQSVPADQAAGAVSTSFTPSSDVLSISVTAPTPAGSAALASAYATAYVDTRVADQTAFFEKNLTLLIEEISSIDSRIAPALTKLDELDQQRADIISTVPQNDQESASRQSLSELIATERAQLSADVSQDQARRRQLETEQNNLIRSRDTMKPAAVLISDASAPGAPNGASNKFFWLIGGLLGLSIGMAGAFIRERLDRSVQVARDVELALGGRVIGAIPKFGMRARRGQWSLVMVKGRGTAAIQRTREAYRRLRSSVQFLSKADAVKVIVVTSNRPAEGKSTTAANLAISLALGGSKTVLVSADMRRPSLEMSFGLANDRGLSTYLSEKSDTIRSERIAGVEKLLVIPAGPEPSNPGELLSSPRFVALLEHLRASNDIIIIDTPPLGAAADSLTAAAQADGLIAVVDGSKTDTTDLLEMRNELDRAGIRLLGAVLNRDTSQPKGIFGRRSRYGYYTSEQSAAGTESDAPLGARTEAINLTTRTEEPAFDDDFIDDFEEVNDELETTPRQASKASSGGGASARQTSGQRAASIDVAGEPMFVQSRELDQSVPAKRPSTDTSQRPGADAAKAAIRRRNK